MTRSCNVIDAADLDDDLRQGIIGLLDAPELDEVKATHFVKRLARHVAAAHGEPDKPEPEGFVETCLISIRAFHVIIKAAGSDGGREAVDAAKAQINDLLEGLGRK